MPPFTPPLPNRLAYCGQCAVCRFELTFEHEFQVALITYITLYSQNTAPAVALGMAILQARQLARNKAIIAYEATTRYRFCFSKATPAA